MIARSRTKVARRLRRQSTEAENRLWRGLRERLPAYRFRRQHPITQFVVDFACPARKLAIEIDGGQHAEQQLTDVACTEELARRGYRVIRFWNNEVMPNLPGFWIGFDENWSGEEIPLAALQGGVEGAEMANARYCGDNLDALRGEIAATASI